MRTTIYQTFDDLKFLASIQFAALVLLFRVRVLVVCQASKLQLETKSGSFPVYAEIDSSNLGTWDFIGSHGSAAVVGTIPCIVGR